ncbi:MAG: hypothetical protein QXI93_03625 [Candidatus Methanomethylicia archaeon]
MKTAYTFCPASISSFFSPYIVDDPLKSGAIGGGFLLDIGVKVIVKADYSNGPLELISKINGVPFDSFIVNKVLDLMGIHGDLNYKIEVEQFIDVPIGCGYGTSGASALAVTMGLCKVLNIKMTLLQMARIAHLVDYYCGTGLGTVSGIIGGVGGIRIIVNPGGPGYAIVDRILIPDECYIVSAAFAPIDKKGILKTPGRLNHLEIIGKNTLNSILSEPSAENFLRSCRDFAFKAGFMTPRVESLIKAIDNTNVIGVTQNMIGEAVHVLIYPEDLDYVKSVFMKFFNSEDIIIARIDDRGPRYLSEQCFSGV